MDRKRILLISCYELGHQPIGLASPMAFMRKAGYESEAMDLSVEPLDPERIARAEFVAISVPMHTALRLGVQVARRVRQINPGAHICFFGLYAKLNAGYLLEEVADSVVGGEREEDLVAQVEGRAVSGLGFPVPERSALPPLERYAHLERDGARIVAGVVEATRGCRHLCTHCPIPPVYGGRFTLVPADVVLQDVRRQVAAGAGHITFADPDFLNGPGHVMPIVRAMHAEFPTVSFDVTVKVEHILRKRDLFPELARLGCLFVVSAVESLSDTVLGHLKKGHTAADVAEALRIVHGAGLALRPTFVPFTPWATLDDYRRLLEFVDREALVGHVDPVQWTIRLLVPPGSLLLESPAMKPHLGRLAPEKLAYAWRHPDPRMDELQRAVTTAVERGGGFVEAAALAEYSPVGPPGPIAARLSEPWFC